MNAARHVIESAVVGWDGVSSQSASFRRSRVPPRQGRLHGDRLADLPFPTKIRDELVASGRAEPHHALPSSGWVSRYMDDPADVDEVIAPFRLNYDRLTTRRNKSS